MSYNGWANHSTWAANLYLHQSFRELAETFAHDVAKWDREDLRYFTGNDDYKQLADMCKDHFYEVIDYDNLSPIAKDLMSDELIDWQEIANTYLDQVLSDLTWDQRLNNN